MRKTTSNPFLGSLRQVAIAIGKREKINIVFEGSSAKTNGKTICLPAALPADDDEIEVLLRGYLDHEVGHIKHTDFNVYSLPAEALIYTITNIVEDIRIEQEMGKEYPGCAVNLRELTSYLKNTGAMKFNKKAEAIESLLMAISYGSRVKHLRNPLKEEADAYRRLAGKYLGPTAEAIIDMAIVKSGCLASTAEARALAEEILNLLKQAAQEQPQQPQAPSQPESGDSQEQQGDQDEQQGEGQGSGGDSDGQENGEPSEGSGSGSEKQGDDQQEEGPSSGGSEDENSDGSQGAAAGTEEESQSDGNATSGGSAGGQFAGDETPSGQSGQAQSGPTEKQLEALERLCDANGSDMDRISEKLDIGKQAAKQIDKGKDPNSMPIVDSGNNTAEVAETKSGAGGYKGEEILQLARKTVGLRGKLAGLFQASKLKRDTPNLVGQKIDQRAVHRIAAMTPDTRIFQQRREKKADNTAIAILVDSSGSMGGTISLATSSAYSVAKAIESMPGVECAVAAFPQGSGRRGVLSLKDFSEKSSSSRFGIGASGGTPTDVALRWAGQKIWPRQETRKIVLVLTDGEPNDPATTKVMAQLLKDNGIECYGIGIGIGTGQSVKALFGEQSSKEIGDISQLADAMFDTLTAAMTGRR